MLILSCDIFVESFNDVMVLSLICLLDKISRAREGAKSTVSRERKATP